MGAKVILALCGTALSLIFLASGERLAAFFVRPPAELSPEYARYLEQNSARLFEIRTVEGRRLLVQNPVFWELKPPQRLPLEKAPGTRRILVIGESSAEALGQAMRQEIERNDAGGRYEILNCAISGGDLEIVARREQECLDYSPDAVVVLFGHNVFTRHPHVPPWLLRPLLWFRGSALLGLAGGLFRKDPHWDTDETRLNALERFLASTGQAARERGLVLVLSTVPSNLWTQPKSDPAEEREPAYLEALFDFETGKRARAVARLEAACRGSRSSLCHFTLGQWLFEEKQWRGSFDQLTAARDLDPRRFRATTAINSLIRGQAGRDQALLLDAEALMRRESPRGIPGWDLFADAQHVDRRNFDRLAKEVLGTLASRGLKEPLELRSPLSQDAELGRESIINAFYDIPRANPPRPDPNAWPTFAFFVEAHLPFFLKKGDDGLAAAFPEPRMRAAAYLGLAEALWRAERRALAHSKNEKARELDPGWDQPYFQEGLFRLRSNQRAEALEAFERAIKADGDDAPARFFVDRLRVAVPR